MTLLRINIIHTWIVRKYCWINSVDGDLITKSILSRNQKNKNFHQKKRKKFNSVIAKTLINYMT